MGFNRKTLGRVVITLTYFQTDPESGLFIKDEETGEAKPNPCRFVFRRRREKEARAEEAEAILPGGAQPKQPLSNVETLQALLIERPTGFDDWPETGTLAEQIGEYFTNEEAIVIGEQALAYYYDCVIPAEFFRGRPNVRMEVSGARQPT